MKRYIKQLTSWITGNKEKVTVPENVQTVVIDGGSQPHVLQHHMAVNNMTHGETVLADIPQVGLRKMEDGSMVMFFCHTLGLEIKKKISEGDGGSLPDEVTIHNILVSKDLTPGHFYLKNVQVTSNGTMQVLATADTELERM